MKVRQKIHKWLLYIKWFVTEDIWYYLGFKYRIGKHYNIIKMARLFRLINLELRGTITEEEMKRFNK